MLLGKLQALCPLLLMAHWLFCIALGVAIPNIFARKWIAPHRRAKLERMIDERRQRGKFVDLHNYNID